MKNNLHGVYLTGILTEMCRRVDANYEDINFNKDKWYNDYSWSRVEQDKFLEWLSRHLLSMGPRRELCKYPSLVRSKKDRDKFAEQFASQFCWQLAD